MIEVKREGDRKTATIERASTVVSSHQPPNVLGFYLGIICGASVYNAPNSQGRVSYLLVLR